MGHFGTSPGQRKFFSHYSATTYVIRSWDTKDGENPWGRSMSDSEKTDTLFWLSVLDAARRVGDRMLEQRARDELVRRGVRIVYQPTDERPHGRKTDKGATDDRQ